MQIDFSTLPGFKAIKRFNVILRASEEVFILDHWRVTFSLLLLIYISRLHMSFVDGK